MTTTPIEQTPLTKYSNKAVTSLSKIGSKILSKIGQKKRIAGKKNRWKKKQNRHIPIYTIG